jgi:uncharacterized coiled-coil protein SlyX
MIKRLKVFVWWLTGGPERLQLAWDRIIALEQQSSRQQQRLELLGDSLANVQMEVKQAQKQISDLRCIITNRPTDPPPLKRARTFREVAQFMGDENNAA